MVSKEFVEERMRQVLPEPEKVDVDIPTALTDTGFDWKEDLYGYAPVYPSKLNDKYEMPPLWNLHPSPHRYKNTEDILSEIAELPLDTGYNRKFWTAGRRGEKRNYHIPQVINEHNKPFGCYWLKPDKDDSIILDGKIIGKASSNPFDYRGRKITPASNTWDISGVSPEGCKFEWEMLFSDSHPTIDYSLQGTLWTSYYENDDSWGGGRSKHPDADWGDANKPNWTRPLEFTNVWLTGNEVYGTAYLGLKQLGFWGALDTAINFIEGVEWSYDVGGKPLWI